MSGRTSSVDFTNYYNKCVEQEYNTSQLLKSNLY